MNISETTRGLNERAVPELTRLPRPVYARAEDIPERKATQPHSHPWVQLSYASRGVLKIRSRGGLFVAPPQKAILIPPDLEHIVVNSPGTQMRSLYIATEALPDTGRNCEVLAVSDLLREAIRHFSMLPVEYDESGPQGRLVGVMLDLVKAAPREALSLPWPETQGLRDICATMLDAPEQALRREEWSTALGVSIRTLERLFLRETGMPMRSWRLRARLLEALPMLERGDPVTEVALACGYESTSAFIASFRQFFGATPGSFSAQAGGPPGRSGS